MKKMIEELKYQRLHNSMAIRVEVEHFQYIYFERSLICVLFIIFVPTLSEQSLSEPDFLQIGYQ